MKNPIVNNMLNLEEYILQAEPAQHERGKIWQTAIGLQQATLDERFTADFSNEVRRRYK